MIAPQYKTVPGSQVFATAGKLPEGATLSMTIQGITLEGKEKPRRLALIWVPPMPMAASVWPPRGCS